MTTKVSYCKTQHTLYRNLLTDIKISFYRNIAILCAEMSRVNWALVRQEGTNVKTGVKGIPLSCRTVESGFFFFEKIATSTSFDIALT